MPVPSLVEYQESIRWWMEGDKFLSAVQFSVPLHLFISLQTQHKLAVGKGTSEIADISKEVVESEVIDVYKLSGGKGSSFYPSWLFSTGSLTPHWC